MHPAHYYYYHYTHTPYHSALAMLAIYISIHPSIHPSYTPQKTFNYITQSSITLPELTSRLGGAAA